MLESLASQHGPTGYRYMVHDAYPVHSARIVKKFFEKQSNLILIDDFPCNSVDLYPMPEIWSQFIFHLNHMRANKTELRSLDDLWNVINLQWPSFCDSVFATLPISSIAYKLVDICDPPSA